MINRLFIKLPLFIILFACICTGIIPLIYWIITGNDPTDFIDEINDL